VYFKFDLPWPWATIGYRRLCRCWVLSAVRDTNVSDPNTRRRLFFKKISQEK
jgi:hypothetical protein